MTWLRVVAPEDEPTAISPPVLPEEPVPAAPGAAANVAPDALPPAPEAAKVPLDAAAEAPDTAKVPREAVTPAPDAAIRLPLGAAPRLAPDAAAPLDAAHAPDAPHPPPHPAFARGTKKSIAHRRELLGKYELREKLGRGSFGVVYLARDPSLDRDIAIKLLRPKHLSNKDIVQRFLQEARATARIAHPGVVTIYDCGFVETAQGPTAFIAMELLAGESLTERVERCGRLAAASAVEIARQVASALDAAHRVNVLHRDLKPDNIFLVPDPAMPSGERVKILDFGLAKLGNAGLTQVQSVFGTPRYMSPEQCRSTMQADHRSDIYSLGCVLFELIAGQPPFDGDVRQVIERQRHASPPRVRQFAPDCPPALDMLIAEMLAKDPVARPQTMVAVQRALHHTGLCPVVPEVTQLPVRPLAAQPPTPARDPVIAARPLTSPRHLAVATPPRHLVVAGQPPDAHDGAISGELVVAASPEAPPDRAKRGHPAIPSRPPTVHPMAPGNPTAGYPGVAPTSYPAAPAGPVTLEIVAPAPTPLDVVCTRAVSRTTLTRAAYYRVQRLGRTKLVALRVIALAAVAAMLAWFRRSPAGPGDLTKR